MATQQIDILKYLDCLRSVFDGDIASDYAERLIMATDNSIYHVLPQAVLYPKHAVDIQRIFQVANQPEFRAITFAPRGGGTGTNGQSLTAGIVIDCSRYMTSILEVNKDEKWVRVQPGVVLDDLNAALKIHGLFFAPTVSPSNRATIGGMFGTDASGKGSRIYGKTSQHILGVKSILVDGSLFLANSTLSSEDNNQTSFTKELISKLLNIYQSNKDEIESVFPRLSRHQTAYNFFDVFHSSEKRYNLCSLLSGSEGTLSVVTELKLKLIPIPKYKSLFVVHYQTLEEALCEAPHLVAFNPLAIETMDRHVLKNLSKLNLSDTVLSCFESVSNQSVVHYIEFVSDSLIDLQTQEDHLIRYLKKKSHVFLRFDDQAQMSELWQIRKKCVGLLLKSHRFTKPIPFIEDCAVPIESLALFIKDFVALLETRNISFGFYGHVDVGCMHVRPEIDTNQEGCENLIDDLTTELTLLTKKYNGVLWGEHGRGFRSSLDHHYFSTQLRYAFRELKTLFDPFNRLNPGKISSSLSEHSAPLLSVRSPMQMHLDRQVPQSQQSAFLASFSCNGNGACFSTKISDLMCPSYKISKNRLQAPKGRAVLIREWLRLKNEKSMELPFFEDSVYQSMSTCLSCRACTSGCPVNVDIPEYRSKFLAVYFQSRKRPFQHVLVSNLESILPYISKFPGIFNALMFNRFSQLITKKLGLIDLPKLSKVPNPIKVVNFDVDCSNLADVLLVQDPFSRFYNAPILSALHHLFSVIGIRVQFLPYRPIGKPLHVLGYTEKFKSVAQAQYDQLKKYASLEKPIVCLEPSILSCLEFDYPSVLQSMSRLPISSIQSYLETLAPLLKPFIHSNQRFAVLFPHCMESGRSDCLDKIWQKLFQQFNINLQIADVGCCGMAGLFGHQSENIDMSKALFELTWRSQLESFSNLPVLVSGFSCQKQIQRLSQYKIQHPIEFLAKNISV